ncbi:hypothetical protein LOK49_LG02G02138 [Camellia lanceoleosa]|uniref:Uncharacterized protein n=1 Tax=Camellia lanceoleosa TaxID=1840588 RepID=A0ACC0INB5_9ERIC|nr:hypothetical protein LOK49_LG02G02138 [Camellia lanceoleosa]
MTMIVFMTTMTMMIMVMVMITVFCFVEHLLNMLRVGHRSNSCNESTPPEVNKQWSSTAGGERLREEAEVDTGLTTNKKQDLRETSRTKFGPWMKVTNQKRNARGLRNPRGGKQQQGNRFQSLQDEEEPLDHQKAQFAKEKEQEPMSLGHQTLGFKYKEKSPGHTDKKDMGATQLDTAIEKKREDLIKGKEEINEGGTREHQSEYLPEDDTTTHSPQHQSPVKTPTNSLVITPSHPPISSQPRKDTTRSKVRDPPDKHGGRGGRELPSGVPQIESTQSAAVSHTRERSVSTHQLRMVDRGSKHEDPTMETNRGKPGEALCFHNISNGNGR